MPRQLIRAGVNALTNKLANFKLTPGKLIGYGMTGYFGISGYNDARAEGKSRLSSIGSGLMDTVLPELMGNGLYMGMLAMEAAPSLVVGGAQTAFSMARENQRVVQNQAPFRNNTFVDSQQIYTMRQAGMALAEQSKYQLQQTLMGNEAQYLHR